jgi:hypothetical protein
LVRKRALETGVAVSGRAYDIIVAKNDTDFVLKSWFDASAATERLGPSDNLVIGLNPPFGKNNSLANQFVRHAVDQFRPRILVLIVPPSTLIPADYRLAFEDRNMCRGEEFYVPGGCGYLM